MRCRADGVINLSDPTSPRRHHRGQQKRTWAPPANPRPAANRQPTIERETALTWPGPRACHSDSTAWATSNPPGPETIAPESGSSTGFQRHNTTPVARNHRAPPILSVEAYRALIIGQGRGLSIETRRLCSRDPAIVGTAQRLSMATAGRRPTPAHHPAEGRAKRHSRTSQPATLAGSSRRGHFGCPPGPGFRT